MAGTADGGSAAQLGSTRALAEEGGGENRDGTVRIRTRSAEGEDRQLGDAWSRRRRRGVAAWARVCGHRKEQGSIVPTFEKF